MNETRVEGGAARRVAGREETRARILAAARALIPGAGASLPVTAIARHAGVAIQTIYDQFGSKGGLLIAVVNDVQTSLGAYEAFAKVFRSPTGEAALRRMISATISIWHQAWPYIEFLLRARRVDPVVTREMDYIDRLRHAHYLAITTRLAEEARLRHGLSAESAADHAFALTSPAVYEEIAARRGGTAESVVESSTLAVLAAILEPGAAGNATRPPDWVALEQAAVARLKASGSDPARLSPSWGGGVAPAGSVASPELSGKAAKAPKGR